MLQKSETNNAIITKLCNVRAHPNADRLKLATVLGTQVIVGLDAKDGDLVIYFDSNLRLSHEYLHYNNLYSNKELNIDQNQKGYFGKNGRVRAQKFRGEVSNGYVASVNSLDFIDAVECSEIVFNVGDEFTHMDGLEICSKYFIPTTHVQGKGKVHKPISDMFHKHWDTKQLMRELDRIPDGAACYIEEKIHGTSGRTGNVLCKTDRPFWKFWKPKEEWRILSGTRRVDNVENHLPEIRKEIERKVAPHLHKGEEIYYEIYGYEGGKEIQAGFHYDCRGGEFKCLLYRVTITTPDDYCIDLDRGKVYQRANELGLESPMLLAYDTWENVKDEIPSLVTGRSTLDAGTLREGVVVWFQNKNGNWDCLKHKSEEFLMDQDKRYEKEQGDVEDEL